MALTDASHDIHSAVARPLPRNMILRAWALYRQRAALAALDDTALADIGLTADAARAEAERPVWDAPGYWKA